MTQAEYEKVMGINPSAFTEKQIAASGFKPPLPEGEEAAGGWAKKVAGKDTSRYPVETVSWDDAMEFCRRLSAMPAERARTAGLSPADRSGVGICLPAGTTTRWYCGDDEAGLAGAAGSRRTRAG